MPCLDCGAPTGGATRCPRHTATAAYVREARRGTRAQRGYDAQHDRSRKAAIEAEPWCHRTGGCPHPDAGTPANPLTGEHIVPLRQGGTNEASNYAVLCHRCNSDWRHAHAAPGSPESVGG